MQGESGGERKRTSVAVELVIRPAVVYLDEPTTGLALYSASQLVGVLKQVAASGSAVCLTIHQPASELFYQMDDLLLLNEGRVMLSGPTRELSDAFASAGGQIQSCRLDVECSTNSCPRRTTKDQYLLSARQSAAKIVEHRRISFFGQTAALLYREVINLIRFPDAVAVRWGGDTVLVILVSLIYMCGNQRSHGAVQPSQLVWGPCRNPNYGAMEMRRAILTLLPQDRPVFLREYATRHYSVAVYFLVRTITESFLAAVQIFMQSLLHVHIMDLNMSLGQFFAINYAETGIAVLLGSIVEDNRTAAELMPVALIPQFLFTGFFVAMDLIHSWLQWAQYACAFTYSIRLSLIQEFDNCGSDDAQVLCDEVLARNSVEPNE